MKKRKTNFIKHALEVRFEGSEEILSSEKQKEVRIMHNGKHVVIIAYIALMATIAMEEMEEEEDNDKTEAVKKKTKKELAEIKAETKKGVKYLATLPAYDYVNISPLLN